MKLAILQLSDMHLTSTKSNPVLARVAAIKAAVTARISEDCALLLVYNGDIAFSGKPFVLTLATPFMRELAPNSKPLVE